MSINLKIQKKWTNTKKNAISFIRTDKMGYSHKREIYENELTIATCNWEAPQKHSSNETRHR